MRKTQHKKRHLKKRKTIRKKRGGDCGCAKKQYPIPEIFGGYGPASYQGGINDKIIPLNGAITSANDPSDSSNIAQERFSPNLFGGKRKSKKRKGGMSYDVLLGDSLNKNAFLGMGTSTGSINMANGIMGKK
uniref:Uncharacterized protein n=1 Tax=viral metagenome TaxID=1070528 RepID=A0A6C0B784_9ZZZZ